MIGDWSALKSLALHMNLPQVTLEFPFGNETLKAHGKMWCWWSPYADGAVFYAEFDERDMLIAADPATFFLHPHYKNHRYILVRAGYISPDWAQTRLLARWRDLASKRWLAAWDVQNG